MPMPSGSLVKVLEAQIAEADLTTSEVGAQRERNHKNYSLQPLGNEQKGRSHYVSPDVLDSVEAKKAIFTETFFSGRQIVKFTAAGTASQAQEDVKTAYVNSVLVKNDSYALFRDGWHDAFVAKRMTLYVRWEERDERVSVSVEGATMQQAGMLLQTAVKGERVLDVDDSQLAMEQAATGEVLFTGQITAVVDRSLPVIKLVQPERFYRDPNAAYINEGAFCVMQEDLTRGQLVDMGFDPAQAITLRSDYRFGAQSEDSARKQHDGSYSSRGRANRTAEQELVTIYRTYTWLSESTVAGSGQPGGQIQLYEILWGHGEVLRWADGSEAIRVVEEMPFFEWTEYKIAHAEHGMSDADVLAHSQRVNSTLKRLILDNQQMRNTPRWEAVHGAVKNPRDLIDNKIGGVVWSSRIGSVAPLPAPDLSPMTTAILQMLKNDNDARTGVSDLAKGMSTDALRYQNAADMIERLTNASNRRVMKAARDFAETLLVPLCKYIAKLGKRHDYRLHQLNVNGQHVEIVPAEGFGDYESECRVQVALTAEQGTHHAQTLLMLHSILIADPVASQLYQLNQRYALFDAVFDSIGVSDSTRYLMRPTDPQLLQSQQQQQQIQQKQLQDQMMLVELEKVERQMRIQALQAAEAREAERLQIERNRFQLEAADKAADNAREDDKLAWQKLTDTAEYALENEQNRAVKIGAGLKA